jgi:hypothetical protein
MPASSKCVMAVWRRWWNRQTSDAGLLLSGFPFGELSGLPPLFSRRSENLRDSRSSVSRRTRTLVPSPFPRHSLHLRLYEHVGIDSRPSPECAREFQKLLAHRGIVLNYPPAALAHLGLGRAYALARDTGKAKPAYQDFLASFTTN